MPTTVPAAALRELHRLHGQLVDLRARLERGPKQVAAHRGNVERLEQELADAHERVKQTRVAADQKQLDLRSSDARLKNWKSQLDSSTSPKEYQALSEQIAAAEMAASVLADEGLELMERVDELVAKGVEAAATLAAGRDELAKVDAQVERTATALRGEIERLEADLAVAEKALPGEFKDDYRRVVRNKGADGLAPCEDNTCQGCGQQVTPNMENDLRLSKPVFCKVCGCLLYLPE
ncbi:MAG: zinc ribbon domain-containing protein [Lacipirellulaceae bacterium]